MLRDVKVDGGSVRAVVVELDLGMRESDEDVYYTAFKTRFLSIKFSRNRFRGIWTRNAGHLGWGTLNSLIPFC